MIRSAFVFALSFSAVIAWSQVPCVDGLAGEYPCEGLDLLSVRSLEELGGGANGNDCWGWVDPETEREFVLYGRSNGLSILDVTDPVNPDYLANVPTASVQSLWRDVKVFDNHAFIVSEAPAHGMQVVDLTEVTQITDGPIDLLPVAVYLGFGNAHNIVMNEASGHAYAVGTNTAGGGLHVIDVNDPANPVIAGTFEASYTHDAQVVMYTGPDQDHTGQEVAFCFNEDHVAIVDVTDKTDMTLISDLTYAQVEYTHQGWLSEDQTFLYFNDELDERTWGHGTRTYIADVSDLDNPSVLGYYDSPNTAVDHNLYVKGDKVYASNYMSGLRMSTIRDNGQLEPYAYFDVRPDSDTSTFYGTWSNYPYLPSGNIAVSCRSVGLFMLKEPAPVSELNEAVVEPAVGPLTIHPNPSRGDVVLAGMPEATEIRVLNVLGKEVKGWRRVLELSGLHVNLADLEDGIYLIQARTARGDMRTSRAVLKR